MATEQLRLLAAGLEFARRELHPDVTAQRLRVLIAAHDHPGSSQRELLAILGDTSITALSRNIADLSALTSRKTPGPGLIELRIDPMNLRVRRVYLTRAGQSFVRRWAEFVQKATEVDA